MKTFLLDLWHDLRAKRLWPVAILLAVAVAAVPLALRKPAEEPPAPSASAAPAKAADAEAEELAVRALEEGAVPSSKLNTFSAKNPFRPLVKEPSVKEVADQIDSGSDGSDDGGSASGGGSTGGGDTSSGGGDTGGGDTGGGDTGGDDTGGDDGSDETTTTKYTYVIDVTFTANDRTRRIKGMERLDILPTSANPLLLFLGVSEDAGNAVFLVDSTLTAAGEGTCKPNNDECAFVYLGAGSEHQFTNEDGDSYTLRIDEIRKVKVDDSKGKAAAARDNERPRAGAAVGRPARRRFVPPILSDLVVVATGAADDSDSGTDRR